MEVKTCTKCGEAKPLDSFYAQRAAKDGLSPHCRTCCAARKAAGKEQAKIARKTRDAALIARDFTPPSDYRKRCPKCAIVKPATEYHKQRANLDGLQSKCKACSHVYGRANAARINARSAAWYAANKERHASNGRAWAEVNRERKLAKQKEYREANRDKINAGIKDWVRRNPERSAAKIKAWAQRNRDKRAESTRRYRLKNPVDPAKARECHAAWRAANPDKARALSQKRRARKRGAVGTYNHGDIKAIYAAQKGKCAYCRKSLKSGYHVDHIVPLCLGGTNWPSNLQLTCQTCNLKKHAKDSIVFAQGLGLLL